MKNYNELVTEIDTKFNDCKNNIIQHYEDMEEGQEVGEFYDKCLNEIYTFMPYYTFHIYFKNVGYSQALELNAYGV